MKDFALDYDAHQVGRSALVVHADCLEWMSRVSKESVHAIVTDPPYGKKEYEMNQLEKRKEGTGGIWRIPPSFDGNTRTPLPRFTALSAKDRRELRAFLSEWSQLAVRVLKPGGHILLAANSYLAPLVYDAIIEGGLEYRGQIIRNSVKTLRGGDRPKGAEKEFRGVCTMPRAYYEPWGLFRKKLGEDLRVQDCLRSHSTGGLRRNPDGNPLADVIESRKTPKQERDISGHSSLKPQSFLRKLVRAALPLGEGVVLDPFAGSGSTLAAGEAVGYRSIGIERQLGHVEESQEVIPKLAAIETEEIQGELALA